MMLQGAIRSELFRAVRSGQTIFWAYGLVPAGLLLIGLAGHFDFQGVGVSATPMRFEVLLRVFASAGNPFVHLLYAIGAATLFAGEYGWETLRLIVPRNSRTNIVLAKFTTYSLFVLASLIGSFLAVLIPAALALLLSGELGFALPELMLPRLLVALLGSQLEAMVVGAAVAMVAVISRSLITAVLVPFLGSLAITMLLEYLAAPPDTVLLLLLPPFAGDAARYWAERSADEPANALLAVFALASLAAWASILVAATLVVFKEQDLANE